MRGGLGFSRRSVFSPRFVDFGRILSLSALFFLLFLHIAPPHHHTHRHTQAHTHTHTLSLLSVCCLLLFLNFSL